MLFVSTINLTTSWNYFTYLFAYVLFICLCCVLVRQRLSNKCDATEKKQTVCVNLRGGRRGGRSEGSSEKEDRKGNEENEKRKKKENREKNS